MLESIFQETWSRETWPQYWILDRPLRRSGVNAQTILHELIPYYVRRDGMGPIFQPSESLRLTLHGINELSERDLVIPVFLQVLGFFVSKESSYEPTSEKQPTVSEADTIEFLAKGRSQDEAKKMASIVGLLIWEESGILMSGVSKSLDGHEWAITLSSEVSRFQGVENIGDYFAKSPLYAPQQPAIDASIESELVTQTENAPALTPTYWRAFLTFLSRWTEKIVIGVITGVIVGVLVVLITKR